MVRVGIVGLGMMGTMHIGAYGKIKGAQLAAICDQDPKRASGDLSDAWSNLGDSGVSQLDMTQVKGTTDLAELLSWDDIYVVDICVPTPFHKDTALAAIASGKHVLCEKPLGRTAAEARQIVDAANAGKGLFMPAMCMRFWPQWRYLKQVVDDGRYGPVRSATFRRVASMPPGWFNKGEWSGGAILDLHIHDTDFVYHLFGQPEAVFSRGYAKTSDCTDHIVTQYLYNGDGPPLVYAEGGWAFADSFNFSMRYTVNLDGASMDFDIGRDEALIVHAGGKAEAVPMEGDGYEAELAYFVDCVSRGEAPTVVTGDDAVTSIEIIEAEQRSIESGAVEAL